MPRRLSCLLLPIFLTGSALADTRPDTPLPGANVESLLAAARQASPDLRMADLEAQAAQARIAPAGALPDPILRVELENITRNGQQSATLDPSRVGDTKYTLIQPIPFWGKRDLKRDLASAEATQASARSLDAWSDLASRLKTLYAQYWLGYRVQALTRENIALTRQLEQISQARYASGLAAQQDAIRAEVERSNLENEQLGLDAELGQLHAQINSMLARPGRAPLAPPESLRPIPATLDAADLSRRLQDSNPQLGIEAARVDSAEKNRALTYRNRYPDLALGVAPVQMQSRIDAWSLMLEVSLPLQQGSRRSQERESEHLLDAAAARKMALGHRLQGELDAALLNLDAARQSELISRQKLLPQAELTFKSALAAYENGKVDFATLLDAQRQIRNARLTLLRAQASQQMRLAEIERLLGESL